MLSIHSISREARAVMNYLRKRGLEPVEAVKTMAVATALLAESETSIDEVTTFMREAFRAIQEDRKESHQ